MNSFTVELVKQDVSKTVDTLMGVQDKIDKMYELITRLEEENKQLKDEHYKDAELAECKDTIDILRKLLDYSFSIPEEEYEAIKKWQEQHEIDKHNGVMAHGVCGGRYTYCFTPTSIGTVGTVKCSCGEEFTFSEI